MTNASGRIKRRESLMRLQFYFDNKLKYNRGMYDYGLVGNCQTSGLIHKSGSLDWLCLPRPDSPPVFGKLLDPEGGHFSIAPEGPFESHQEYIANTNVLVTTVTAAD